MMFYTEKITPRATNRQNDLHVFIDSDAFVGWLFEADNHHRQANAIFSNLEAQQAQVTTSSFVIAETATVLSHRSGQAKALTFLKIIDRGNIPVIQVDSELQQAALDIFKIQEKKGTSVTDCANVAIMRRLNIPAIFSFDQVYTKKFDLQMMGE